VLVNLAGGNDLLNTFVPLDDVGAPQRTLYQQYRPNLAIPMGSLGGMAVGADPVLGTGLALHPHPALGGLKQLYDEGRLACVLGAGLAGNSLSHFEAEKAWFFGRPDVLTSQTGWLGRHLDLGDDGLPHAVSFGGMVNPTFHAQLAQALGVGSIARFEFPDDRDWQWRDGAASAASRASSFPTIGIGSGVTATRAPRRSRRSWPRRERVPARRWRAPAAP
jgi:uncharacterized protein (DUF1501 family)